MAKLRLPSYRQNVVDLRLDPVCVHNAWDHETTEVYRLYRTIVRRHVHPPLPVVHDLKDLVKLEEFDYEIFVGNGMVRYLTLKDLSAEIRFKLAMVMSQDSPEACREDPPLNEVPISAWLVLNEDFKDIGWRISKNFLCLVLPMKTILELRGERP